MINLDALALAAERATPGPWMVECDRYKDCSVTKADLCQHERWPIASGMGPSEDLTFIAACDPTTILALCAELRAAREVIGAAYGVCSAWNPDNAFSKPGTSIGYLRDAMAQYDSATGRAT